MNDSSEQLFSLFKTYTQTHQQTLLYVKQMNYNLKDNEELLASSILDPKRSAN